MDEPVFRSIPIAAPLIAIGLTAAAPSTSSAVTVIARNSLTEACAHHAELAGEGKMAPAFAVYTCTQALATEAIDDAETAKLLNNRGVVQLTLMGAVADAKSDFDEAASLDPKLGES